MEKKFAMVTGASQGIGRAISEQLASMGQQLILIALPDSGLEDTVKHLQEKYKIDVWYLPTDLTIEENIAAVHKWFVSLDIPLHTLVNNAGMGYSGWFHESPENTIQSIMKLNNEAMVLMSRYFIPELKKYGKSHIMNIGSMESFFPLPYKAVYTGTKHFVYGFSLALREELRAHNIHVSVVCPGPVPTNEEGMKRYIAQGWKSKILSKMPDEVARIAIEKMYKGNTIVIPGTANRIVNRVSRIVPTSLKMKILEKLFRVYVE